MRSAVTLARWNRPTVNSRRYIPDFEERSATLRMKRPGQCRQKCVRARQDKAMSVEHHAALLLQEKVLLR